VVNIREMITVCGELGEMGKNEGKNIEVKR
jgi:hypothetical protein